VKHGGDPWHATFNRIDLLYDEIQKGYRGWILYLDADAYVFDVAFDSRSYLDSRRDHGLIALPVGTKIPTWNINAGILFFNASNPSARSIIIRWKIVFDLYRYTFLYYSVRMAKIVNDQSLLHLVLRTSPRLLESVYFENRASTFVRQLLRAYYPDLALRVQTMERLVQEALAKLDRDAKTRAPLPQGPLGGAI
jgi:hypothetical protein